MIFLLFPYTNLQRRKFDLAVKKAKGQPMIIIWTLLVELESSMLYIKIQPQRFLGSGDEDCQEILPYIDMTSILFIVRNYLNKMAIPFWQNAHVKSGENCSSSFREDI